tara:strand:+ start:937 stop:2196 length:1260 start_codon:yes stop_codon:yes gene_type:complete
MPIYVSNTKFKPDRIHFPSSASDPGGASHELGDMYFNTTDKELKIYKNRDGVGMGFTSMFTSVEDAASPFTLTLQSSDNSRLGDNTSTQNIWWASQTYSSGMVTNIGQQSYQGFYAFTAGSGMTLTATLGGAAGWGNCRGRSITATFSVSTGDRLVFFAGKPTNKATTGQTLGAAGGASCLMKYVGGSDSGDTINGFTPLIIAAGGSAGAPGHGMQSGSFGSNYELSSSAAALSVTTGNSNSTIATARNAYQTWSSFPSTSGWGGGGRGRPNSAQSGGCGWAGPAVNENGNTYDGVNGTAAVALAYGALGCEKANADGADGGFGGGGADYDQNYYGSGGGGYWGGYESNGASSTDGGGSYFYYTTSGSGASNLAAPLSYVHSSGTNVTDNGLWSGTSSYNWANTNNNQQIKGRVYLSFT